jgi:hypothetical protein
MLGERREEFRSIAFRLLRRGNMKLHALLGHPVSENFVSWCQTLKNSSASFLCIQEHLFHLLWFKNVYIWSAFVLCMMSGQLISNFVRYWTGSSSRHFLRFLSNIFKKQSRNFCFTPLLFCMNHNDLPTNWIFIKESARWSGIHYYNVAFFNRKWPQQKQFSPTFRNIVFCEANASKGKKNDILEN